MRKRKLTLLYVTSVLFVGIYCTESPFGETTIQPENYQIGGTVVLSDSLNSQGTYVWMEGLDIGTYVGNDSRFQITIPNRNQQAAPGGISGAFRIYFYLANYYLTTAAVAIKNGQFIYDQMDLDSNGWIEEPVKLEKFLDISSTIFPSNHQKGSVQTHTVQVKFHAIGTSVRVSFLKHIDHKFASLVLKDTETGQYHFLELSGPASSTDPLVLVEEIDQIRTFFLVLGYDQFLPEGTYEVLPFIKIFHDPVPNGLLKSLGIDIEEVNATILSTPIKIDSDTLIVKMK